MSDPLMTVEQVAELLAIPLPTAYEQLRKGVIPGRIQIGRRVRVSRAAVEAWIEPGRRRWKAHFTSCPQADQWRRR